MKDYIYYINKPKQFILIEKEGFGYTMKITPLRNIVYKKDENAETKLAE